VIHTCTKFELSSFNRSVDKRGYKIFNEGHVTLDMPLGAICFSSVSTCHDAPTYHIWSL